MRLNMLAPLVALPLLVAATGWAGEGDELAPYAKAIEENADDAKAYEAFATKAIALGKLDDAVARLKVGVARLGEFPRGYYLLAYLFRKKQAWADAADYYRRYIALRPSENDSYFGLGKALAGLGDKKGAVTAFKKYVAQEKRPQMQKFVDEANVELARLEPPPPPSIAAPASPSALRTEADQLRVAKRFEEAAAAYRRAIEADQSNLDLYNDLGNVYFAMKRYAEAAQAFKDAVRRDSLYALGWYNLAHAYRKADKKSEAVDAYQKYMLLRPDDPDPYYGLGQTLKALSDVPAAIVAFRKYVEMEKRPEEQRWVEKARQELAALEQSQKAPPPAAPSSGKIDDKAAFDEAPSGMQPGDIVSPFRGATSPPPRGIVDPFQPVR